MRNRTLCTFFVTTFVVFNLLAAPLRAQPLADRVPEDVLVYVGWCGATHMPSGYQGSHFKALLDESNIPELFTQFVPALINRASREQPQAEQHFKTMMALARPMWKYPTAAYFGGIEGQGEQTVPKLALICRAGGEAQQVHDMLAAALAEAGDDVPFRALHEGELVGVYSGYADEQAALAGQGGGAGNPLGASASFKAAAANVQSDPVIVVFADVERAIALVDQTVEQEGPEQAKEYWPKARDASGLSGVRRAIFTKGFDGKDWFTYGFIEAPAPRKGMLALLDSKPVSDELLKSVPQSASMVFAGKFDPGAFVKQAREVTGAVDPKAQQMFDQGLGAAQMFIGKNLQTDILDPLGEDWALYLAPEVGGNGLTGVVVVNKLDDAKRAEQGLVALCLCVNNLVAGQMKGQELSVSFKNTMIGDMRVWYFAVPFVAPAWGIKDGNLYLGLYPQSVAAASRFKAGEQGRKSFLENEKYLALKQRLGVQQPRGVQFVDLPQVAGPGYQLLLVYLRMGLGFADMWGVQAPEPVLPAYDRLLAHLAPSGSLSWVDDKGWHTKGVAPFPGSGILSGEQGVVAGAGGMMAGILLPSLNRARETANRVKCASNLRQLGQAAMLYANENNGQFPPDMQTLVQYSINDAGVEARTFVCPSGEHFDAGAHAAHMQPDGAVAWTVEHTDYVYVAGLDHRAGFEKVLIYERPGPHDKDGINALFADGHVEFLVMPMAQRKFAEQNIELPGGR